MSDKWPRVPLGQVLTHRSEFITIDDTKRYLRPRVQWYGLGVARRDAVDGASIKTKQQQICHAGELLVAEIDAKEGGFGIVPDELEGAIVSSHYFLFCIDQSQLCPRFLNYFLRTHAFQSQVSSQGSTNYSAVRPAQILRYGMPLPPLPEQRRIIARIEELAGRIAEAKGLRDLANVEINSLAISSMTNMRRRLEQENHPAQLLGDLTTVTAGGTPDRGNPAFWCGNIPWIKTGELVDGDIATAEEMITEEAIRDSSAKIFPADTVLIALYGQGQTRGRTGRLAIPAATNQACCAILPTPSIVRPRFVQYWLRSLYSELRAETRDGAQPNWNGGMIKNLAIRIPQLSAQDEIVGQLDDLLAVQLKAMCAGQATGQELDALLPSILDKAFRGEL